MIGVNSYAQLGVIDDDPFVLVLVIQQLREEVEILWPIVAS